MFFCARANSAVAFLGQCNNHLDSINGSYGGYQRFLHINEAKGSFSLVLTP